MYHSYISAYIGDLETDKNRSIGNFGKGTMEPLDVLQKVCMNSFIFPMTYFMCPVSQLPKLVSKDNKQNNKTQTMTRIVGKLTAFLLLISFSGLVSVSIRNIRD